MGVNHVQLGNGETVVDLRGVTVNEDVLLEGYTAIDSKGNPVTGKASSPGGGSAVEEIEIITCDFDLLTMTISNLSYTYQQIVDALNANKYCVFKVTIINGLTFATVSALNTIDNQVQLQLLVYGNIDESGLKLYFFNIVIEQDNSTTVQPKLVSTVG